MRKNRLSVDGSVVFSVASRPASPGNSLVLQPADTGHFLGMDSTVCCNQPSGACCGQSVRRKAVCKDKCNREKVGVGAEEGTEANRS